MKELKQRDNGEYMGSKKNFLRTNDIYTKDKLLELGFTLVSSDNGYTFVNDSNLVFSKNEKLKFTETNILCI